VMFREGQLVEFIEGYETKQGMGGISENS
jgi:hypothetical protein